MMLMMEEDGDVGREEDGWLMLGWFFQYVSRRRSLCRKLGGGQWGGGGAMADPASGTMPIWRGMVGENGDHCSDVEEEERAAQARR